MAIPLAIASVVIAGISYITGSREAKQAQENEDKRVTLVADQQEKQRQFDLEEATRIRDEEVAAEIEAAELAAEQERIRIKGETEAEALAAGRAEDERIKGVEEEERDRLAEEARVRAEEERQEEERFTQERSAVQNEYGLEVERLGKESDMAAIQAEEEISASRMRTQQAQEDLTKHEEVVMAAQTVGFAARGLAPGSSSALAVMKNSADLAEAERMKLQANFDLFATTRRSEASRVQESGEISLRHLASRIDTATESGRLALKHMREQGDIAAEVGEFSLAQFQASNNRELSFASQFLDLDIEAATRKGERAQRAINALEEGEQYISTNLILQTEANASRRRYDNLGLLTGFAGSVFDLGGKLNKAGFFDTNKSPFFTSSGSTQRSSIQ